MSVIAALAGWVAAVAGTLPMELWRICSDSVGGLAPLLQSIAMGFLVWSVWTLFIMCAMWCCGLLPILAVVREGWLLRRRGWAVAFGGMLGLSVVLVKFKVWHALMGPHRSVTGWLFTLYCLAFTIFGSFTTAVYSRLVARGDRQG